MACFRLVDPTILESPGTRKNTQYGIRGAYCVLRIVICKTFLALKSLMIIPQTAIPFRRDRDRARLTGSGKSPFAEFLAYFLDLFPFAETGSLLGCQFVE